MREYSIALVTIAFTQVQGQSYKATAGSQIKVAGTSNLHDWTMLASNFSSEGNFIVKDGELQELKTQQ